MASKRDRQKGGGIDEFRAHVTRTRQLHIGGLIAESRRIGASARRRRRALEAVAKSAGLDLRAIDEGHEKDWKTILKQAAIQHGAAEALARQERARERQTLRTIVEHRERFEYKKGNPRTSICLWTATRRASSSSSPAPGGAMSGRPSIPLPSGSTSRLYS
jgi:hypothetical protein